MMRSSLLISLLLLVISSPASADLGGDVKAILRDKYLTQVEMGIAVARLGPKAGEAEVIYRFESDIPLIPASNLKVLTTSAFLDRFGPQFKFHTVLLKKGDDVYLMGDGDPT